ncbi:hypothetical protein AAMO2058_000786600 [Amorphochlora amoebiformis]
MLRGLYDVAWQVSEWWANIDHRETVNLPGYSRQLHAWTDRKRGIRYKVETVITYSGSSNTVTERWLMEDKVVTLKVESGRATLITELPNRRKSAKEASSAMASILTPLYPGIAHSYSHPVLMELEGKIPLCVMRDSKSISAKRLLLTKEVFRFEKDDRLMAYVLTNSAENITQSSLFLTDNWLVEVLDRKVSIKIKISDVHVSRHSSEWGILISTDTVHITTKDGKEIPFENLPSGSGQFFVQALSIQRRWATGRSVEAIKLESTNYQPNSIETGHVIDNVKVLHCLSKTVPKIGVNFGSLEKRIWVDKGCRAVFEVTFSDEKDQKKGQDLVNFSEEKDKKQSKEVVKDCSLSDDQVDRAPKRQPPIIRDFYNSEIFDMKVLEKIYSYLRGEDAKPTRTERSLSSLAHDAPSRHLLGIIRSHTGDAT